MKRARKKNTESALKKLDIKEYKYKSDMTELGYNPDEFFPDEEEKEQDITMEAPDNEPEKSKENEGAEEAAQDDILEGVEIIEYEEPGEERVVYAKRKKSEKGKKKTVFLASIITLVILFFVVLGFGGLFETGEITENFMAPVDKATGEINVLLLGVDKEGLRTDTIMIANYDLDDDEIKILSIPRDTRMYVGKMYQKINAAHAISQSGKIKGPQGTIEAVTRLTGIPINYYVEFSFDAFKNTIDALDGVYFDVPRDMYYKDPTQNLYINLKKGYQLLDGDKAEQFVRFRQYPNGDLDRVVAQQAFISAVAEQKLNVTILKKLPDLFDVLKKDVKTNFTVIDITRYAKNLEDLSAENVKMYQLPGNFSGPEYKASYWIADMDKVRTLIETEFSYDASKATIHSADGKSISKDKTDGIKVTASPTALPEETEKPIDETPEPEDNVRPTKEPEDDEPTKKPTQKPTQKPTDKPTDKPTEEPTQKPAVRPTKEPEPEDAPTYKPTRPTPKAVVKDEA